MYSKQRNLVIAVLVCLSLFAVGLIRLFNMRFSAGDVYPVYSSLRSDPLGTQVLFESINAVGDNAARRNYRPLEKMKTLDGNTLVVCGLAERSGFFRTDAWDGLLDQLALDGGRLVVTFRPSKRWARKQCSECDEETTEEPENTAPDDDEDDSGARESDIKTDGDEDDTLPKLPLWFGLMNELGLSVVNSEADTIADFALREEQTPRWLPELIPWRSNLEFKLDSDVWHIVYRRDGAPVLVQRSWGNATIIFSADSYLLSNEALRSHREPLLLSWLLPLDRSVIFDEFHNGLIKELGIAGLMRKYRLYGVLAVLALLVVLLLWQQAAVFVPRPSGADEAARHAAIGSETAEGWVSLMQQHIHPGRLLAVCYDAWRGSPAAERLPEARREAVNLLMTEGDAGKRPPVIWYRQICELIKQGKRP